MRNLLALIAGAAVALLLFGGVAVAPAVLVALIAGFLAGQAGRREDHG
jgi:hypothetical protein